jgi:outer membrane receptor for monomeric catechols
VFIEGYNRLDLNLYYTGFAGWHLSIQIRNLTDNVHIERYRDVVSNNYFGSPRAVLFRASYSF